MNSQIEQFITQMQIPDSFLNMLISSGILILIMIVLQSVVSRFIKRQVDATDLRRRWLVQSRNGLVLILIFGLIMIWGEELRTLALSVVALAMALVIATKELILCISGSIIKATSGSFNIGDRIQVKDFRGDVIDQNFLTTTIMEVGPGKITHQHTGRVTVLPNAIFVSEPVINESHTENYVLHVFTVPFKREDDWKAAQEAFLESARRHCKPYQEAVRRHMKRISDKQGLDAPNVEPRVTVQMPAAAEVHLIVRVPARSNQRGNIEQAILLDVFEKNSFVPVNPEVLGEVGETTDSKLEESAE